MSNRRIFRLSGADITEFLQGLITNDMAHLEDGMVYAAMLTPQGKYIADFFLIRDNDTVLLDVDADQADTLIKRLNMYKLRADVTIVETDLHMHRCTTDVPKDGFADPRHASLGWRAYRDEPAPEDTDNWTALRVAQVIPKGGVELGADTFILEAGFERLNGVDFRKGCYVGQEVTARMKHKTELRKGLAKVRISGPATPGTEITANGKPVGTLHSRTETEAIAYLRFDRANGPMQAGSAQVTRLP
jgi:folate-binding protein YgfZ